MAAEAVASGDGREGHHGAGRDDPGRGAGSVTANNAGWSERTGIIEIEFGCGARVWLYGEVLFDTFRQMIELLR